MKKLNFLLLIIIISCEKEELKNLHINTDLVATIISGNNQEGYLLQELDSNLVIKITDKKGRPYYPAKFELLNDESGYICEKYNYPLLIKGERSINWLLPCNLGVQNAPILVSDSLNRVIDTLVFTATAKHSPTWNRSCGLPIGTCFSFDLTASIVNHPDGRVFLLSHDGGQLYESTDQGETWSKFETTNFQGEFFDITHDGVFYANSILGLYKSNDGKSWTKLFDKEVLDYTVFDNGRITIYYSSFSFDRYISNDYGQTWIKDLSIPTYSKIIRISNNTFIAKDRDNHANLLISNDNGITWEPLDGLSNFYDIVDIAYNNGFLFLTNLEGTNSIPVIYKSPIENWSWIKLATLTKKPHNYPSIARLKFFKDKVYALTDINIYQIESSGDTISLTNDVVNKINIISTYEISTDGKILIGCNAGAFPNNGVFYRNLN